MNVDLVLDAVRAFAEDNAGLFPEDLSTDVTASGQTVIDLLPDGLRPLNPYTGDATEPRDELATAPGQTGYAVKNATRVNYGYTINAYGEDLFGDPLFEVSETR